MAANVRQQATGVVVPLITDPGTARAMDLLNVVYEVLLQLLSRYFAHTDETPDQLACSPTSRSGSCSGRSSRSDRS